jgi:hypothetical protein
MRHSIQKLRNAELKRAESRAKQEVLVEMRGYGGRPVSPSTLVEGRRGLGAGRAVARRLTRE